MCLAVPGRVVSVTGDDPLTRTARVDFGGVAKEVGLALLPDAAIGDYVLVHVGVALTRIDEAEAQAVFGYLAEIGALEEELP